MSLLRSPSPVSLTAWLVAVALIAGCSPQGAKGVPADGAASAPDASRPPDPPPSSRADAAAPGTDAVNPGNPPGPPSGALAEHGGGSTSAVAIVGSLVYLAVGPRLAIWDLADRSAPKMRGQTAPVYAMVNDVAVAGKYAYVVDQREFFEGHLRVVDVSDPSKPREVSVTATGPAFAVAVVGAQLFVALEADTAIYDLTDPTAPKLARTLKGTGGGRFRLVGTRLYYWGRTWIGTTIFGAIDTTTGTNLGASSLNEGGLDVAEGNLLVAVGSAGTQVYDVTDVKRPVQRFTSKTIPSLGVVAAGQTAWLPSSTGLFTLDLSTPTAVTVTGPVAAPTDGNSTSAAAGNLLVVVTDRGTMVPFDISQPKAPVARGSTDVTLCDNCVGVRVAGDSLFLAASSGGLRTGRLADLAPLGHGHPGQRPDFEDLVVVNGLAYVADWYFGLRAYDVANPAVPRPVFELAMQANPSSIAYENNRLYLGQTTNGGVIWAFDLANPAKPVQLGLAATSQVWGIEARNNILYVAAGNLEGAPGMQIIDASVPSAMKKLSLYPCSHGVGVALAGTTAVLGCTDGFHLVDVSKPAQPVRRALWAPPSPHSAQSVAVSGSRAYFGHTGGLAVFDITNPAAPRPVGERPTPYPVRGLTVPAPGRVLAACGLAGVYQWIFE
jgi:hypothetical protein